MWVLCRMRPMFGFFNKLQKGLEKTSRSVGAGLRTLLVGGRLDDAAFEAIEEVLIGADVGVETTLELVEDLRAKRFDATVNEVEVRTFLAERIEEKLKPAEAVLELNAKPFMLLMVGVNGAGKTTTIGKLAEKFKANGQRVVLVAGDTFRAGAVQQLQAWATRVNVPFVAPEKEGADPASLMFKALEGAGAQADVLIADTAGRLQNRTDLMAQLEKIVRVVRKKDEKAPHATWLVLDATVGQNALSQVENFQKICGLTGLVVTKLDGSAKAGVVVALAEKFKLPIYYIGVGESVNDLQVFNARSFARALLDLPEE